jgi:aspartate aminotransferase-like enzyme
MFEKISFFRFFFIFLRRILLAGRNFLFVPGPTNVPDRVNRSMMISMEDHRSPIFPRLYEAILPGLKKTL